MRAAAGLALAAAMLSGCRTPGPVAPGPDPIGLAITIDQPADGSHGSARVDDRRWLEVPAAGTIELPGVAAELELDRLLIESITRPAAQRIEGCALLDHVEALTSGWILGRAVAVTTVGGVEVAGTVVEVGEPVAVVMVGADRVEVPLADVTPLTSDASVPPVAGSAVLIDSETGPRVGAMQGRSVASLVVHDRAGVRHAIRFSAIARLRIPELTATPTVRCRVRSSRPGRHAIRLAYRTGAARWRAGYQVAGVAEASTSIVLAPRYTVELAGLRGPAAGEAADVTLRALPAGDEATPIVVWHGSVALDGEPITVAGTLSTRAARVRRWYPGAAPVEDGTDPRGRAWGRDSSGQVWRELVFERAATDVPGDLRVGLADGAGGTRWYQGALPQMPAAGTRVVRVPLGVDPELIGFRERLIHDDDGLADEVRLSVANRGAAPVQVILEEPLRPLGRPAVRFAAPAPGTLGAAVWQLEVVVPAGGLERAAVLIQYPDEP